MEVILHGSELARFLADIILDKKGTDIQILDIREHAVFTDYFVLCNGENRRQLKALADSIAEAAKIEADLLPKGIEGSAESGWVLVDFNDVIIHIFSPEQRNFYKLEELWQEAYTLLRMQ